MTGGGAGGEKGGEGGKGGAVGGEGGEGGLGGGEGGGGDCTASVIVYAIVPPHDVIPQHAPTMTYWPPVIAVKEAYEQ